MSRASDRARFPRTLDEAFGYGTSRDFAGKLPRHKIAERALRVATIAVCVVTLLVVLFTGGHSCIR